MVTNIRNWKSFVKENKPWSVKKELEWPESGEQNPRNNEETPHHDTNALSLVKIHDLFVQQTDISLVTLRSWRFNQFVNGKHNVRETCFLWDCWMKYLRKWILGLITSTLENNKTLWVWPACVLPMQGDNFFFKYKLLWLFYRNIVLSHMS